MARLSFRRLIPGLTWRLFKSELITTWRSRRTAFFGLFCAKMALFAFNVMSPISRTVIWSSEKRESNSFTMPRIVFVGVYYPAPSSTLSALPEGYVLTSSELSYIRTKMPGVPVTFDHRGVSFALQNAGSLGAGSASEIAALAFDGSSDPKHRPLGKVIDAWAGQDGAQWCAFTLDFGLSSTLLYLINEGFLRGISLTHIKTTRPEPIELSLCASPARPACGITATFTNAFELERYKGLTARGTLPSLTTNTMTSQMDVTSDAASTPPSIDDIMKIVSSLEPGARDTLTNHIVQMNDVVVASKAKLESAATKTSQLEKEVQDLHRTHETDNAIMKDTIEQLISTMTELDPKTAGMLSCRETLIKDMNGPNVPLSSKRAMDQLLVCASRVMMNQKMNASSDEGKRIRFNGAAATESAPSAAAPAVIEPVLSKESPEDKLRSALASHFERSA